MRNVTADETRAREQVQSLLGSFPLPHGGELDLVFFERTRVIELELFMAGLTARLPGGVQAVGSAAALDGFPAERAFFELLERISVLLALPSRGALVLRSEDGAELDRCKAREVFPADRRPARVRASLSNGVALHRTWREAAESARAELVERDRVLRSFRTGWAPEPTALPEGFPAEALSAGYEPLAVAFDPGEPGELSYRVRGVFLFPRQDVHPLAYGFAAGRDAKSALAGAAREALQRLAFLFGEEIPHRPPAPSATPDYHQEFYLVPAHHGRLRQWLDGGRDVPEGAPAAFDGADVRFADLTPPSLADRLAVVRALSSRAMPLRFGVNERKAHTDPHPIA